MPRKKKLTGPELVKEWRYENRLTLRKMAEMLGCSLVTVWRLEQKEPTPKMALKLEKKLKLSRYDTCPSFFGGSRG